MQRAWKPLTETADENRGWKPRMQREVLFGCFKKKLTGEIKVAQLSGADGAVGRSHPGTRA